MSQRGEAAEDGKIPRGTNLTLLYILIDIHPSYSSCSPNALRWDHDFHRDPSTLVADLRIPSGKGMRGNG